MSLPPVLIGGGTGVRLVLTHFGLIYFAFMIVFFAESKRLFACRPRGIGKCKKRERYKLLNRGELISFSLIVGRGVITVLTAA